MTKYGYLKLDDLAPPPGWGESDTTQDNIGDNIGDVSGDSSGDNASFLRKILEHTGGIAGSAVNTAVVNPINTLNRLVNWDHQLPQVPIPERANLLDRFVGGGLGYAVPFGGLSKGLTAAPALASRVSNLGKALGLNAATSGLVAERDSGENALIGGALGGLGYGVSKGLRSAAQGLAAGSLGKQRVTNLIGRNINEETLGGAEDVFVPDRNDHGENTLNIIARSFNKVNNHAKRLYSDALDSYRNIQSKRIKIPKYKEIYNDLQVNNDLPTGAIPPDKMVSEIVADSDILPTTGRRRISPIESIESKSSTLGDASAGAHAAGEFNESRKLTALRKALQEDITTSIKDNGKDPSLLKEARAYYKDEVAPFGHHKTTRIVRQNLSSYGLPPAGTGSSPARLVANLFGKPEDFSMRNLENAAKYLGGGDEGMEIAKKVAKDSFLHRATSRDGILDSKSFYNIWSKIPKNMLNELFDKKEINDFNMMFKDNLLKTKFGGVINSQGALNKEQFVSRYNKLQNKEKNILFGSDRDAIDKAIKNKALTNDSGAFLKLLGRVGGALFALHLMPHHGLIAPMIGFKAAQSGEGTIGKGLTNIAEKLSLDKMRTNPDLLSRMAAVTSTRNNLTDPTQQEE